MRPVVHPEAEDELRGAAYVRIASAPGLGGRFLEDYEHALKRILAAPEMYRVFVGQTRKTSLDNFPYAIIYRVRGEEILIDCVMHLHPRPHYWIRRQ